MCKGWRKTEYQLSYSMNIRMEGDGLKGLDEEGRMLSSRILEAPKNERWKIVDGNTSDSRSLLQETKTDRRL